MNDWGLVTLQALQNFWQGFLEYIPNILGALIVFIIGWFISAGVGRVIAEILKKIKFDQLFRSKGWQEALERADLKVKPAEFIGAICKWILVIVFLLISVEILGLEQFSIFLGKVVSYLGNVFAAVFILVVTVIIADIAEKLIKAGIHGVKVGYADLAGLIAKWAIWFFGLFAILLQLGLAKELILALFQGLVALIAIAGGLAFGLGGKELAQDFLRDFKEKVRR
jgi:hypothetical protein